jgi:uncharacterized membrane protein YedE/YeeE
MNLTALNEAYGEPYVLAVGGLLIGLLFGYFAQRSKFCLRAAVVEFWHRQFGEKLSVWLLTFSAAVIAIQGLIVMGDLDVSTARQLASRGSLSGALVGGLLFGAGMIMTRGCASRLLVLSANGNLRALLSGLIFAVTAQSALSGALSPLRQEITNWWTVEGGAKTYVGKISALWRDRLRLGQAATHVIRSPRGVTVMTSAGIAQNFDHVILACHGDQALRLIETPTADEVDRELQPLPRNRQPLVVERVRRDNQRVARDHAAAIHEIFAARPLDPHVGKCHGWHC